MLDVLWLIPAFPLAGFLIILLFGRRLGEPLAGCIATLMVAASFVRLGGRVHRHARDELRGALARRT